MENNKSSATHSYCLQSDVMPVRVLQQTSAFYANYRLAMQQLNPAVEPDCISHTLYTELLIPNNPVCMERSRGFINKHQHHFDALRITLLPGKLVLDQKPPNFRSPLWLRALLLFNVLLCILTYVVAFDRLTFL